MRRRTFLQSLLASAAITPALLRDVYARPSALHALAAGPKVPKSKSTEDKDIKFLVLGDWGRNGQVNQQDVADRMGTYNETFDANFILSVGDNFYCCGVASVDDPQWMSSFENVYRNQSLQIDWYVLLGNHDYEGNTQAQLDYTKRSRRWVMPARYHTIRRQLGPSDTALFVFLDSNPWIEKYLSEPEKFDHVQREWGDRELVWLEKILSQSKDRWKIVSGHHPVYSSGSEHGDQPELIKRLKPLLDRYHVDAYFSGHEHDLQHQRPEGSTVNYFVSGAGSRTRPKGTGPFTKFSSDSPGFMAVSLTLTSLNVKAIDTKGNTLYARTISK